MIKFLAVVAAFFVLPMVVAPVEAEAQQIIVPPCPSDADCHFRAWESERENVRVWNNNGGGQYPPPPVYNPYPPPPPQYYGGGNRQQCGNRSGGWWFGVQSDEGSLCFGGGGGNRGSSGQGGTYQGQGPAVAQQCAPGERRQGNTCTGCRPGLVFAEHPQTRQLICVTPRR